MNTIRITISDTKKLNLSWKLTGLWEIDHETEDGNVMIRRVEEPMVEYIAKNLTRYELSKDTVEKLKK